MPHAERFGHKILLACASGQLGGTEIRVLEEARQLKAMGHDAIVAVGAFPQENAYRDLLSKTDIPVVSLDPPMLLNDWPRRHLHWLRAELFYHQKLARIAPDLIHVFFPWTSQGLDHLWLAGRCGIPSIISAHNAFPKTEFSDWHRRHLVTAFRTLRGVYGVSRSALDNFVSNFQNFFPADASRNVIYNFVDMSRFQPSPTRRAETRSLLSITQAAPLIGSVGRFEPQKQPISLVNVFARITKERSDARLLLIGEGRLQPEVEARIAQLGLAQSVTILPFQSEIENFLPALDVHLLLSRNEGFGIVTAEAMACGVPVVGTRVTGTEEVIGDCRAGRLVALGDEDEAAAAVFELLSLNLDKSRSLAEIARNHVGANFSKQVWERDIDKFYSYALAAS